MGSVGQVVKVLLLHGEGGHDLNPLLLPGKVDILKVKGRADGDDLNQLAVICGPEEDGVRQGCVGWQSTCGQHTCRSTDLGLVLHWSPSIAAKPDLVPLEGPPTGGWPPMARRGPSGCRAPVGVCRF